VVAVAVAGVVAVMGRVAVVVAVGGAVAAVAIGV